VPNEDAQPVDGHPDRGETPAERLDRQLGELVQEVRVALPGVQVLFAFLLTVPFSARWDRTTGLQRDTFFATLLLTAVATVMLMAPTAIHRMRFEQGDKRHIVRTGHRLVTAGIGVLGLAMTTAVFLITDVLFSTRAAVGVAAGFLTLVLLVWFAAPLSRRFTRDRAPGG
jgi:hypothetical protein